MFYSCLAAVRSKHGKYFLVGALVIIGGMALAQQLAGVSSADAIDLRITTIAGGWIGDGGRANSGRLNAPSDVAVDAAGNLYIADNRNHRIRRVSPDGAISTFAGTGESGFSGDGGLAVDAKLNLPFAIDVDSSGALLIADTGNNRVRRVSASGIISTVAGSGSTGPGGDGIDALDATLNAPEGIAADSSGNVYVAESLGHRVRKFSIGGQMLTVAGIGTAGFSGDGGPGSSAMLNYPGGLALDLAGNLFIADSYNHRIRRLSSAGVLTTFWGNGTNSCSQAAYPNSVEVRADGFVYFSDNCGVHGDYLNLPVADFDGEPRGDGETANRGRVQAPMGLAFDSLGNLYIADFYDQRVRKIDRQRESLLSTVAGSDAIGGSTAATAALSFSSGPITSMSGLAYDAVGNLFVADTQNHIVRKMSPSGAVTTVAGTGLPGVSLDPGPATSARLDQPTDVFVDAANNLWIADRNNYRVRRVGPDGIISTIAGGGAYGVLGDGGLPTKAFLDRPISITVDSTGNLYILEEFGCRVRKVVPGSIITTVAGTDCTGGALGDGGPATLAKLRRPRGIAVDSAGNLLIADTFNHRVRKVSADGIIRTVAGTGTKGFSGDGAAAQSATLATPGDVAVSSDGTLLIADMDNGRLRSVSPDGLIRTLAGNGARGFSGDGESAQAASLFWPTALALDREGNVAFIDNANQRIRKLGPATGVTVPGLSIGDNTVVEGESGTKMMVFTVRLSRPSESAVTFDLSTANRSAEAGSDYSSRRLTRQSLAAGTLSKTFAISISGDLTVESEESFVVNVTNVSAATVIDGQAVGVIVNDDFAPHIFLTVADAETTEGNAGSHKLVFPVTLSRPAAATVTATFYVYATVATPGVDYLGGPWPVTFAPGETTALLSMDIFGDTAVEPDEIIQVDFDTRMLGVLPGRSFAVGRILNDDGVSNVAPTPDFVVTTSGLHVDFFDRSSDVDGTIVSRQWEFGDLLGESNALNPSNSYSSDGAYSVTLTVKDNAGALRSLTRTVSVARPATLIGSDQYLWMVPPASSVERQGFLRLTNRGVTSGQVLLWGIDSNGRRSPGSATLTLSSRESRQFNSGDLEAGNVSKGLVGSIGAGEGDWTILVRSDIEVEALAYIRTPDGFLTSMHDRVDGDGVDWFVPIFNPADNPNQLSVLRVVNTDFPTVDMTIIGVDDAGRTGAQVLTLSLPSLKSVHLNAVDLERGNPAKGLNGSLGDGNGKWHLSISSTGRVTVQSLLSDPIGKLTNLSELPDVSERVPGEKILWLVTPASNTQQQTFVRLVNRENRAGTVAVWGIDDAGRRSPGTITMNLSALESKQLNSQDLEGGNAAKGISGSLGDGSENWRLVVLTDLDIVPIALIRTPDGFLTTIHETVSGTGTELRVPIFNPAENPNQVSLLRVVNTNAQAASVIIRGVDDLGTTAPSGDVSFTLGPGEATELTAADLESGNLPKGLTGRLGNGSGKWALTVTSTTAVKVMGMLRDPNGYLTNLSSTPKGDDSKLSR